MESEYSESEHSGNFMVGISRNIRESLLLVLPTIPVVLLPVLLLQIPMFSHGTFFLGWYYFTISIFLVFTVRMYREYSQQLAEEWNDPFPRGHYEYESLREYLSEIWDDFWDTPEPEEHIGDSVTRPVIPYLAFAIGNLVLSAVVFIGWGSVLALFSLVGDLQSTAETIVNSQGVLAIAHSLGSSSLPVQITAESGLFPEDPTTALIVLVLLLPPFAVWSLGVRNLYEASENAHRNLFSFLASDRTPTPNYEPIYYAILAVLYISVILTI